MINRQISHSPAGDTAQLFGRLCLATVFLSSAFGLVRPAAAELQQIEKLGLPGNAKLLAMLAGTCEVAGAASLVTGVYTRPSAVLLASFLGYISVKTLNFWSTEAAPEAIAAQRETFVGNVAIIGGLIYLATAGPGSFALGSTDSDAAS